MRSDALLSMVGVLYRLARPLRRGIVLASDDQQGAERRCATQFAVRMIDQHVVFGDVVRLHPGVDRVPVDPRAVRRQ